jgi:hypothetical protein
VVRDFFLETNDTFLKNKLIRIAFILKNFSHSCLRGLILLPKILCNKNSYTGLNTFQVSHVAYGTRIKYKKKIFSKMMLSSSMHI